MVNTGIWLSFRKHREPIHFTKEFFPETFSSKKIDANALIIDLCSLLGLNRQKFTYDFVDDSRDIEGMPYEIQGDPFECEMDIETTPEGYLYHLVLAKTLLNHPGRLLLNMIIETVKAKQYENNVSFGKRASKRICWHITLVSTSALEYCYIKI